MYLVDAVTNNAGAAGGVLTTWDGKLLGMIGRELRNAENNLWINYAIPVEELRATIEAIRTGDFSPQPAPTGDHDPQRQPSGKNRLAPSEPSHGS